MRLKVEKSLVKEIVNDTAEVSIAGDLTAATPYLSEAGVRDRVDVLGGAGDVPGIRPELREIIGRCGRPDVLTGNARVYREPAEILGREVFAGFDEVCVNIDPNDPATDMAYRRLAAAVFAPFLTQDERELLTGINGRSGHEQV